MSGLHLHVAAPDAPEAQALIREEARRISARYPALTAAHFDLGRSADGFEARADLRFPQHQIIVDAMAAAPERAVRDVFAKAERELARLEARDPSVAAAPHAIAA